MRLTCDVFVSMIALVLFLATVPRQIKNAPMPISTAAKT